MLTLHTRPCSRMKVAVPKRSKKNPPGFVPPPIPLERPESKELEKDDYVALKLKTVPRSSTSAEYSLNVPYFVAALQKNG